MWQMLEENVKYKKLIMYQSCPNCDKYPNLENCPVCKGAKIISTITGTPPYRPSKEEIAEIMKEYETQRVKEEEAYKLSLVFRKEPTFVTLDQINHGIGFSLGEIHNNYFVECEYPDLTKFAIPDFTELWINDRNVGNTTRIVDATIQLLFMGYAVALVDGYVGANGVKKYCTLYNEKVLVNELKKRISNRLKNEHGITVLQCNEEGNVIWLDRRYLNR